MSVGIKYGESGDKIKELQEALIKLGYPLPRWGADGIAGQETFDAIQSFFLYSMNIDLSTQMLIDRIELIQQYYVNIIMDAAKLSATQPSCMVDIRDRHPGKKRIRRRSWKEITGITLHQTATLLGEKWERWKNVGVHFGVSRKGKSFFLNDLSWKMPQAQRVFNNHDVGLEIDGYYAGVGGNLRTFWKPKSKPNRKPLSKSKDQIIATRDTVKYIVDEVAKNGGKIRFIHAHRQTSASRTSDPGEMLWREVGIWAQQELGLSDGGHGYSILTGNPIPGEWDERYKDIPYR